MLRRTSPAIVLLFAGCFGSHGTDPRADAGAIDAGGRCEPRAASVLEIACRATPEGAARAIITTSPNLCCGSGSVTPSVRAGSGTVDVDLAWTACDCSETLRCVAPIETLDVPLGTLAPGSWVVRAAGAVCALEIAPPSTCRAGDIDSLRMTQLIFDDQLFVASAQAPGTGSCGCRPSFRGTGSPLDLRRIELCGCCDECDCIDSGYDVGFVGGTYPVGTHDVLVPSNVVPGGMTSFEVTSRERCVPLEPAALDTLVPMGGYTPGGPRVHWAAVEGTPRACCTLPRLAVDAAPSPTGELVLTLYDCTNDDCDCPGTPRPGRALYPLIDLPPGRHILRAGAHTATLDLP